jgi:hypothetical protein
MQRLTCPVAAGFVRNAASGARFKCRNVRCHPRAGLIGVNFYSDSHRATRLSEGVPAYGRN